ncbi:MAG: hypothetical protein MRQ11_04385 [Candidatus Midichloria mitochondrii]|nr:hypothetical protein [Candidatus Midichloria mitochondrii]MDJ1288389.1 hypothetical protein [Candidatus Midichloria mitochondrii]MDJ1299228.1 hypothetical protein [Candidatus Midichloria mitochondrii]MDJ1313354.1 hypothetical protein [Candidatus Midichloria mitochondrii]MDJ1583911.1 hypothetical protein [Candidatus Midichloria mitochondrii]
MLFTGEATSLDTKSAKNTKPLKISQINNSEYMEYHGKYPVIFADFEDVVEDNFEAIQEKFRDVIKSLFKKHEYLIKVIS